MLQRETRDKFSCNGVGVFLKPLHKATVSLSLSLSLSPHTPQKQNQSRGRRRQFHELEIERLFKTHKHCRFPPHYLLLQFRLVGLEMNWNPHVEVHYYNTSTTTYPYNSAGSFMEYFEGLTYEHVNFIFDGASHLQESVYPSMNSNFYKFGLSESGANSYYQYGHPYEVNYHEPRIEEERRPSNNSSTISNVQAASVNTVRERNTNTTTTRENPVECPRRHHNAHDNQVVWQDNVDPDNMTYEELLELGETVGTQSRGLSQELIASLPISKFKCGFFGKKSRHERCVICQMEYKRGDRRITLPCKHAYHAGCGARWLSINKACPICYTEVFGETSKR